MEEKTNYISWCDHAALPLLSAETVMDYFCKPTNPFYDKTCNNEHLRMQGMGLVSEQMRSMEGLEFMLLHAQPPDLFVIRKQHRSSAVQTTPLVDYYIIRGVVHQAPNLASVLNVRLLNAIHSVRRALDEASSRGKFSVTKSWMSADVEAQPVAKKLNTIKNRQEDPDRPPTAFQKFHVDPALAEMVRRFSPSGQQGLANAAATAAALPAQVQQSAGGEASTTASTKPASVAPPTDAASQQQQPPPPPPPTAASAANPKRSK